VALVLFKSELSTAYGVVVVEDELPPDAATATIPITPTTPRPMITGFTGGIFCVLTTANGSDFTVSADANVGAIARDAAAARIAIFFITFSIIKL
jgi:hypothetical protein